MSSSRLIALEEENTTLRSRLRQQDGQLSRLRLRDEREREAIAYPVLRQRLLDAESSRDRAEAQLAETQQLLRAFQQETYALRTLIKFAEYPDVAAAAREEGERVAALEEAERLREELSALRSEYTLCQNRCHEALHMMQQYRYQFQHQRDESSPPITSKDDAALDSTREDGEEDANDETRQPYQSLSPHAPGRSRVVSTTTDVLADGDVTSTDSAEETSGSRSVYASHRCDPMHDRSPSRKLSTSTAINDAPRAVVRTGADGGRLSQDTLTISEVSDAEADEARTCRVMAVLQGENALLTRRISSVVSQNKHFIATIAQLELRCAELMNKVGGSP